MNGLRSFLFSVQTKLVLSMTGVIIIAIFIAGAVFVARDRYNSKERALERVAASSPVVYEEAIDAIGRQVSETDFYRTIDAIARQQDVRILLVTSDGTVIHDSEGKVDGATLTVPESNQSDQARGFKAWESNENSPEPGLVFLAASTSREFQGIRISQTDVQAFRIVLAVRADTIKDAWLGVLPPLGLAALIAIPLASLLGIILARQVAYPVRRLTAASEAMALGDFSQRVQVHRDDEVGRLARAFTTMAQRVGNRDQQMRALLANVSHDLKTPMTSITGYAQALVDGTADPEDVQHIGQVLGEEAQHVNRLLADLLYLGEIDAGQVVTRREDVPLDEVVGRCIRRIEPATHAKDIEVGADIEPVMLKGADPDKLERAITNVLENAAKFTPAKGAISVVLRRENGSRPPSIVCAVTNSGSSIAGDDLPRIFDRFFRADRARRTANGTGLGLAIARELVELNHGEIAAANEPAGGVTFTMSFPA